MTLIGETIDHYQILEKCGEGGMGVVYKAKDINLDRLVALKFLSNTTSFSEDQKRRFIKEARTTASLEHSNICSVYDLSEYRDQSFIVMPFIEGSSLKEKIRENSQGSDVMSTMDVTYDEIETGAGTEGGSRFFAYDEVLNIALQIADGLKESHDNGIIHRDIKSANIMVNTKGTVKILDFGLAKLVHDTEHTKPGTILGTVSYMSPEQIHAQNVDSRTDIWSLGVVLYEMASSILPFPGNQPQAVIHSILNEEPEPISSIRRDISPDFENLVKKAMKKNPEDRYQKVDDLLIELNALNKKDVLQLPQKMISERKSLKSVWGFRIIFTLIIAGFILGSSSFLYNYFQKTPASIPNPDNIVISFDEMDKEITEIFRTMAKSSGYNIIPDQNINERIHLHVQNEPWEKILDVILESKALGKELLGRKTAEFPMGNVIRIAPLTILEQEKLLKIGFPSKHYFKPIALSLDLKTAGVADLFLTISQVSGLNIVVESGLEHIPMSLTVKDVIWPTIMDLIVKQLRLKAKFGGTKSDEFPYGNVIYIQALDKNLTDGQS